MLSGRESFARMGRSAEDVTSRRPVLKPDGSEEGAVTGKASSSERESGGDKKGG